MIGLQGFRMMHVGALALCAILIPWSTAFLSMAQMLLMANWLTWGIVTKDVGQRFRRGFTWPPALVFISFFGLHAVGLLWTSDLGWGFDLTRILLPVLVFGVVLGASPQLRSSELRTVLLLGAWSVVASVVFSFLVRGPVATDHRALSMFISHIRLALLLVLALVVFLWYAPGPWWRVAAHGLAGLFIHFALDRLQSVQGFFILAVIGLVWSWRKAGGWNRPARTGLRVALVVLPVALLWWGIREARTYYTPPHAEEVGLGHFTPAGEPYTYDTTNPQRENGEYVWAWIAWGEVERMWDQRSDLPLDGPEGGGGTLRGTLVRYLTSMGLRKDSAGVMALSDADVRAIESGQHSAAAANGMRRRIDAVLLELGQYLAYGRADGHSFTQRLEFWRAGGSIAWQHWAIGVGTGDTQQAFDAQYAAMESTLAPEWRYRAHNQFLTLWISFGLLGLLWSLFSWWWPAWKLGAWRDPLFVAWAIAFGISCLSDDTIETQAGATFFAFYYALFVFAAPRGGSPPATGDKAAST